MVTKVFNVSLDHCLWAVNKFYISCRDKFWLYFYVYLCLILIKKIKMLNLKVNPFNAHLENFVQFNSFFKYSFILIYRLNRNFTLSTDSKININKSIQLVSKTKRIKIFSLTNLMWSALHWFHRHCFSQLSSRLLWWF